MVSFKGAHFGQDMILTGVRWYVAYPLSYHQVEELMQERGVSVDHAPINRGVLTQSAPLEEVFHRRKRPVWRSWRMDETDIRVTGEWRSLARAVATHGQTSAVLWTAPRDQEAARRLLKQAIRRHGVPEKSTIDGSAANAAAIQHDHQEHGTLIEIRQITYLHNRVEPDHRGVKRVTRPRLGCKSFEATQATRVGIELMHMLKKGQLVGETRAAGLTPAEPFYALVASPLPQQGSLDHPSKFATEPTRGYWIIPSGRSGAAVSGWVARNHHLHGLVESIIMNVGGCWWNITESER